LYQKQHGSEQGDNEQTFQQRIQLTHTHIPENKIKHPEKLVTASPDNFRPTQTDAEFAVNDTGCQKSPKNG
jgi:hypothetical protein